MNSEKFYRERAGRIGGSDVPSILGLDPRRTPLALWYQKRRYVDDFDRALDEDMSREVPDWVLAGNYLEDGILRWYSDETARDVRSIGVIFHPQYEFLCVHVDGWFQHAKGKNEFGVVDAKNVWSGKAHDWTHGPPPFVVAQVAYGCELLERTGLFGEAGLGSAVALIGGNRIEWHDFDVSWRTPIIDACVQFHESVIEGDPPRPRYGDARTLSEMFPQSESGCVTLGDEFIALDDEYITAKASEGRARRGREEIENLIKAEMGEAEEARVPGTKIRYTWRTGSDGIRRFRRVK